MTEFPKNYREIRGDIFDYFEKRIRHIPIPDTRKPDDYFLLQTISGDCIMGAGIAKEINARYGFKDIVFNYLHDQIPFVIGSVVETHRAPHLMALVTKDRYFEKPTLDTMRLALETLATRVCLENGYSSVEPIELIMPTIGCGLDKLKWEDVRQIIFEVFAEPLEQGWLDIVVIGR